MRELFRNRNFMALWLGQVLSRFGDGVYTIGLAWMVLDLTGSALALGATLAMSVLPALLFGVVIGSWIDRWDPKRIMILCDLGRAVILALVLILYMMNLLGVAVLMAAEFVLAVFALAFNTARSASLPRLISKGELTAANAFQVTTRYLVDIGGKIGGGLIVLWMGVPGALGIDSLSFLLSVVCIGVVRLPGATAQKKAAASALRDFGEFIKYLRPLGNVSRMIGYLLIVNIGVPAIVVELPVIAKFWLNSPTWLGVLQAAFGVGGIVAGLVAVRLSKRWKPASMTPILVAGFGLSLALSAAINNPIALMVLMGLAGLFGPLVLIYVGTAIQSEVEAAYMGRAMAFQNILLSVVPALCLSLYGMITEWVAPNVVLGIAGAAVVVATLVVVMGQPDRTWKQTPESPGV